MEHQSDTTHERGAVLPLLTVVILVLMGFAALGVDATAAYAERRQAQSAADAAVMAAALQYLTTDSPAGDDLLAIVNEYVGLNWGFRAPTEDDWASCTDPSRPGEYAPVVDIDGNELTECLSLKQINGAPSLLRVRLPAYAMPTSFASVIGFDSVAISATATAELKYSTEAAVLPVSIPSNYGLEECLGTPPSGQLPRDPVVCNGSESGSFGILITPFFGADEPHFTNTYPSAASTSCKDRTKPNEVAERASHSFALGLDHLITAHPLADYLEDGTSLGPPVPAAGADDCDFEGSVPYALLISTGTPDTRQAVNDGLIGGMGTASPANPDALGRLRQPSSPGSSGNRLTFDLSSGDFDVDNVALWEYLESGCDAVVSMDDGRAKTKALIDCLGDKTKDPRFNSDLLLSPRFALVPVLNYESCPETNPNSCENGLNGTKWWGVLDFMPVYIQTSWYSCDQSGTECLFQPGDFDIDPADPASYSQLFTPGEGSLSPCLFEDDCQSGSAISSNHLKLRGVTAIVLQWGWLPGDAENQLGSSAPFEVFLHNNE